MKIALLAFAALTIGQVSFASPAPKYENIQELLEGRPQMVGLAQIQAAGFNSGATALDLWSGSYWPHYQGSLAARYRDPMFSTLIKEKAQYKQVKAAFDAHPVSRYENTELLSPAEKYDLLVGDKNFTLTKYSWELGKKTMKGDKVATWRGLCDGWSSAAQMMPRPTKHVVIMSEAGERIVFSPEDIKALGTVLYARAQKNPIFLGKRCYSKLLSFTSMCDEINPAAFHLGLINRVGVMKKSFIADVSPGGEVWNYPVKKYSFKFYNIFDEDQVSKNFSDVMEVFNQKDKKVKFYKEGDRHKQTRYIVGVKATVVYQNMREHNLVDEEGNAADAELVKEYQYDLELDANYNVLGGESMNGDLPDFIWAPNDGTFPLSVAEETTTGLPISQMAQISSKEGQPLASVLRKLFEASAR